MKQLESTHTGPTGTRYGAGGTNAQWIETYYGVKALGSAHAFDKSL